VQIRFSLFKILYAYSENTLKVLSESENTPKELNHIWGMHQKALKVPKCEIFYPFLFTSTNPLWVDDLRTGEFLIFFRRLWQIFAILCFLRMLSVCAKKLPTQAEPALNNCL